MFVFLWLELCRNRRMRMRMIVHIFEWIEFLFVGPSEKIDDENVHSIAETHLTYIKKRFLNWRHSNREFFDDVVNVVFEWEMRDLQQTWSSAEGKVSFLCRFYPSMRRSLTSIGLLSVLLTDRSTKLTSVKRKFFFSLLRSERFPTAKVICSMRVRVRGVVRSQVKSHFFTPTSSIHLRISVGDRFCQHKGIEGECWIREKCPRREKTDVLALIVVQASVTTKKEEAEISIPTELPLIHIKVMHPLLILIRDSVYQPPRELQAYTN